MSRTEDIHSGIWNEPEFFALTAPAKLLYVWSWTNTRCGTSGVYQVPLAAISFETKLSDPEVKDALVELEQATFVFFDGVWLWCKARVKHLKPRTPYMAMAVVKDLRNVPDSSLYWAQFLSLYGDVVWQATRGETTVRTTIREVLDTDPRTTPHPPGTDSAFPAPERNPESHSGSTQVEQGLRLGLGQGKAFKKGWGVGRGNTTAPSTSTTYTPSPGAVAMRDEHFPDYEVGTIEGAAFTLRSRKQQPTPEAIRSLLEGPSDSTEEGRAA